MNAQTAVENQQRLAHSVDDVLCIGLDLIQKLLRAPPLGDVFHRQQDEIGVKRSGVEQHHPAANVWKIVFEDKIVEYGTSGHDVFEQSSQCGQSPLPVAELINVTSLGFRRRDSKGLVERRVRRADAQSGVEDEQRFAHGIKNVLSEILKVGDERPAVRGAIGHVAQNWLSLLRLKAESFGHEI